MATALVLAVGAVGMAAGATTAHVTQTSIAGAKLGQSAAAYKRMLGRPVTSEALDQPEGWTKLDFAKRKVGVYFPQDAEEGIIITTWNRAYKTAAGVGPCSTVARLKGAYGKRLKPSKFNTQSGIVYAWTVGKNLIFASNDHAHVDVIGLYDGSDPNAAKPGGSLSFAGYISLTETACS